MTKETTHDFGAGPIPAHQHINGGGWVADTAEVAPACFVGPHAEVFDKAVVLGRVQILHNAQVFGNARLHDLVRIFDIAKVFDNARMYGSAQAFDESQIFGNATLRESARVYGSARIYGCAILSSTSQVDGQADISSASDVIYGHTREYFWTAFRMKSGGTQLRFGCESHPLDEWDHMSLASRHEPGTDFEEVTKAVAALAKVSINV